MPTPQPMDAMKHPLLYCAVNAFIRSVFMLLLLMGVVSANERQSDPDGCLVCHALEGLQFIDKKGVLRIATIDKVDYFGSLHGSVPCTDCHAMKTYPHEVKDGLTDCSTECHVNEPSKGEKFTHKAVVKEFQKSTHGHGRVKDFEGGNRLEEDGEQDPSCRRCHSNTPYIIPTQMEKFKTEMNHADAECGKCHVGEVWMKQFGGHVLRRLVGSRWNKNDINKSCTQCHGDYERMAKVKIEDPEKRQANQSPLLEGQGIQDGKSLKDKRDMKVTYRWIHSTESYDRTLHARFLVVGEQKSASCLDCHIWRGKGFNGHGILKDEDKAASTHPDNLGKTCGADGCHNYAKSILSQGFAKTDVHDINQVKLPDFKAMLDPAKLDSVWHWSSIVLTLFVVVFGLASIYWLIVEYPKAKKAASNIIGDGRFEEVILGRKPKKAPPKAPAPASNVAKMPPTVAPEKPAAVIAELATVAKAVPVSMATTDQPTIAEAPMTVAPKSDTPGPAANTGDASAERIHPAAVKTPVTEPGAIEKPTVNDHSDATPPKEGEDG